MEIILAILVGLLFSAGVYMLLRRSIVKLIIGVILLSNAINLLIFISAGLRKAAPAFIHAEKAVSSQAADPLPQAMVLTAIVIGFGLIAFFLVLKYKFFELTGTDDLDELKETD